MFEVITKISQKVKLTCTSETKVLKDVILGYADNFHEKFENIEIVNETQKKYYGTKNKPNLKGLIKDFTDFKKTLEYFNVNVRIARPCDSKFHVPDQLTPRDIGFVIGDVFFISNMAKKSRKYEYLGIQHIIDEIPSKRIVEIPKDVVVEGGDIIVDKGFVFVGISQRTNLKGFQFLKSILDYSDFTIVPVKLKSIKQGEDSLHLDCVFNPVGKKHALIYTKGIDAIPIEIKNNYKWINVSKEEQSELATNVLSISDNTVISRDTSHRINKELEKIGINVCQLSFDNAPKTGGSFRCCTLPLRRE